MPNVTMEIQIGITGYCLNLKLACSTCRSIGTAIRGASVIGFSVLCLLYVLCNIFSNIQMSISQPFEELHGWNLEYKLITPKSMTG